MPRNLVVLSLVLFALASCGGGGGSKGFVDDFADQAQGTLGGSGAGSGNGTPTEIRFRTLFTGDMSAITAARRAVARDATEYAALWAEHGHSAPAPDVDFFTETVVAVFIGITVIIISNRADYQIVKFKCAIGSK